MKNIFLLLSVVLCCLLVQPSRAQSSSRFSREIFVGEKGDTLKYRMLNHDQTPNSRYPLVIFLHGSGERGDDNEAQLKWGISNFATDEHMVRYPAIIIAPQCPLGMQWSHFSGRSGDTERRLHPEPSQPMNLLMQLIRKLSSTQPVDTNRIYITGLSMGGFGTYDAIERYPGLFAAAVPVCGGGDTSKAASIAHMPIWIFQGADDPSVSPVFAHDMFRALLAAGAHPGFTQYPATGHFAWLAAYSDEQMMAWLFRQHK